MTGRQLFEAYRMCLTRAITSLAEMQSIAQAVGDTHTNGYAALCAQPLIFLVQQLTEETEPAKPPKNPFDLWRSE